MKIKHLFIGLSIALSSASTNSFGAEDSEAAFLERETLVRELLEVTNSREATMIVMESIKSTLKPIYPESSHQIFDELVASASTEHYENMIVGVYASTFTIDELRHMHRFYTHEMGKSISGKMPLMIKRSMKVGAEWGKHVAAEVRRKMQERGIKELSI